MNKERVTEFLYQAVDLPTSDCSIFYRKRGLGPDQNHYNQSRLWFRLHTTQTLAEITHITPKWIYTEYTVLKIFYRSGFLSNLCLPWKPEFALNVFKPGRAANVKTMPWKRVGWQSGQTVERCHYYITKVTGCKQHSCIGCIMSELVCCNLHRNNREQIHVCVSEPIVLVIIRFGFL